MTLAQRAKSVGGFLASSAAVVLTAFAVLVSQGNVVIALLPLLGVLALYAMYRLPLRYPVLAVFFLALTVDIPQERFADGMWKSPLYIVGAYTFDNFSKRLGVGALAFSGMDVVFVLLCLIVLHRKATGNPIDKQGNVQLSTALVAFVGVMLVALLGWWAYGVARGGNFQQSLWQIRQLVYLPILTFIFQAALRGPQDHVAIGKVIVAAAFWKALAGLYVYEVIARPTGMRPHYTTMHSDSLIFVAAIVVTVTHFLARPTSRRGFWLFVTAAASTVGMVVNNRRLAFVLLGMSLFTLFVMMPRTRIKRAMLKGLVFALPLLPVYMAVGWKSSSGLFKPAQVVRTTLFEEDSSTGTREIENYNLIYTFRQRPLFGSGFGHEYDEVVLGDDISNVFAQYRYVPHNSVLWLLSVGGLVGFTLVWLAFAVFMCLTARAVRYATAPDDRAAGLSAVCIVVCYLLQGYGDMGFQSWIGAFLVAVSFTVGGKLAVAVGAWPRKLAAPRVTSVITGVPA